MAPVNSKFKIRFLFRQRALRTEKREQVFFLLSTSEEFELEKKFLFSTHSKSLCRGAKVMGCAHNNNLGFNFGYFSRREIVLARDIIIVSEQVEEERRVTSSLCEIEQKLTRLSFIGLFLLIGKNSFLYFIFLCLDTLNFYTSKKLNVY